MSPPNEEGLVHDAIEESSESNTAVAPSTCPCEIKTIRLVGLFILLVYVLADIVLSLVGLFTYLSAETGDLEKEFTSPSLFAVVLQILVILCAAGLVFFGFVFRRNWCRGKCLSDDCCVSWCIGFLLADLGLGIAFLLSPEFCATDLVWSLDEYDDFIEAMHMQQPQVILAGATRGCQTNPIVMTGFSSTDESVFPNVSAVLDFLPMVFLRMTGKIRWDAESRNLLEESADFIKRCAWDLLESVNVTKTHMVVGLKERALITKDGTIPWGIRPGGAVATFCLAFELYYLLNVEAIPFIKANIVKNNARIATPVPSCRDVDWKCG
jgi:hypothetical protein